MVTAAAVHSPLVDCATRAPTGRVGGSAIVGHPEHGRPGVSRLQKIALTLGRHPMRRERPSELCAREESARSLYWGSGQSVPVATATKTAAHRMGRKYLRWFMRMRMRDARRGPNTALTIQKQDDRHPPVTREKNEAKYKTHRHLRVSCEVYS